MYISVGCSNYRVLSDFDRGQGFPRAAVVKCDRSIRTAWYRFKGAAGTQMPTQCVAKNHCGTLAPGWLQDGHPTVAEGVVQRTVCFHWNRDCCHWSHFIRVQNCSTFFVYELSSPSFHCVRYCGDNEFGMMFKKKYITCALKTSRVPLDLLTDQFNLIELRHNNF